MTEAQNIGLLLPVLAVAAFSPPPNASAAAMHAAAFAAAEATGLLLAGPLSPGPMAVRYADCAARGLDPRNGRTARWSSCSSQRSNSSSLPIAYSCAETLRATDPVGRRWPSRTCSRDRAAASLDAIVRSGTPSECAISRLVYPWT